MKKIKTLYPYIILFLITLGCHNTNSTKKELHQISENKDSTLIKEINSYKPTNGSGSSFWGDVDEQFDIFRFSELMDNDSIQDARLYLEKNKPQKMDSTNLNIYKSNLSNLLIRQGKFEEAIRLLSDVINTENNQITISERLLRSEAYVQIGQIEDAMTDLTFVIDYGGRFRWRAYRQRGIIKYEILNDSIGGCMDLRKGVANDYTLNIYKKYCN